MKFQKRFTEELKTSGKKQKELAKALNISESNITNWKKGDNLPSIEILHDICIYLKTSADYLLGLEDENGVKIYENKNNKKIINHVNINIKN